jgi:hypothetical protein
MTSIVLPNMRQRSATDRKIKMRIAELQGWKLQEITRDRLRFAAGDAQYDMNFPKPSEIKR